MITENHAIKLAEKYGTFEHTHCSWMFSVHDISIMLNDYEQQVIERLVRDAKVMPKPCIYEGDDSPLYDEPKGVAVDQMREAIAAMQANLEQAEARVAELEKLCDATYVASGADAYNHACDEMERWQAKRRKDGKDVGTEGSLCDGIAWLYGQVDKIDELQARVAELENRQAAIYDAWYAVGADIKGLKWSDFFIAISDAMKQGEHK